MKRSLIVIAILTCSAMLWSQNNPTQSAPGGAPPTTSTDPDSQAKQAPAGTNPQAQKKSQPGTAAPMSGMHAQHMGEMQAVMHRMTALLNQMRSTYAMMDAKNQPAMQANIEMWQMMLNHLQQNMQECPMMKGQDMDGHGMMLHRGQTPAAGTHGAPAHSHGAPTGAAPQQPTSQPQVPPPPQ